MHLSVYLTLNSSKKNETAFRLVPCKPHVHCAILAATGRDFLKNTEGLILQHQRGAEAFVIPKQAQV